MLDTCNEYYQGPNPVGRASGAAIADLARARSEHDHLLLSPRSGNEGSYECIARDSFDQALRRRNFGTSSENEEAMCA